MGSAFVRAMSSSDRVPSASVYEAAAPSPYYPVLPPPVGYDPGAMTTLRDRALYERDLDRLYHINKEERDGAIASQGAIEKELFATKGVMQGVLAEKEQVEDTLHQVKDAGEQLKRQFELALCTSVAERKEYETTVATMHAEREAERAAAASRLGCTVEEYQSKVAVLTKEYETQLSSQQERYETRITVLNNDHASKLQNTILEHETLLSTQKEKYETRLSITISDHESKRKQLSSALAEAHAIRKECEIELDRLRILMRELEEQHKARESTLLFELSSAKKACERLELEKAEAEKKVHKVIEESETMRKVFESALGEADALTKMLRDQLEVVRKTMQEQAQASGREIFQLTEELDASQSQTDRIKLAKYRSETSLQEVNTVNREKELVDVKLRKATDDVSQARYELGSVLKEANALRSERDDTERLLEVMDSRVDDVRKGHGEILSDFDHHYGTLTSTMLDSSRERVVS